MAGSENAQPGGIHKTTLKLKQHYVLYTVISPGCHACYRVIHVLYSFFITYCQVDDSGLLETVLNSWQVLKNAQSGGFHKTTLKLNITIILSPRCHACYRVIHVL